MTLAQLIALLALPQEKVLEVLDSLIAKYPDLAGALLQVKEVVQNLPAAIAEIPTNVFAELKELVETGESEVWDPPLE